MKIVGSGSASGSISQRHVSADPHPDPHENVMDPQHWRKVTDFLSFSVVFSSGKAGRGKNPFLACFMLSWYSDLTLLKGVDYFGGLFIQLVS
jgi:hypothetical protein